MTINRSGETQARMDSHEFTIDDVGRFLVERQRIWHKRTVLVEPPPWTDDEALRHAHYCNVQRELDRGTIYLFGMMDEWRAQRESPKATLVNAGMYRQLNRRDVWDEHVRWVEPTAGGVHEACAKLGALRAAGVSIGPVCWMPSGGTTEGGLEDCGLDLVRHAAALDEVCRQSPGTLEPVHKFLKKNVRRLSGMVGFQVCLDLMRLYPNLNDQDWVFVYGAGGRDHGGDTGSHWTARKLRPDLSTLECARWMRDTQDEWLMPLGWSEVAWEGKPRLTLADCEHGGLCEYRKYLRVRLIGGAKRKYRGA